jgi:hypothetical protein
MHDVTTTDSEKSNSTLLPAKLSVSLHAGVRSGHKIPEEDPKHPEARSRSTIALQKTSLAIKHLIVFVSLSINLNLSQSILTQQTNAIQKNTKTKPQHDSLPYSSNSYLVGEYKSLRFFLPE